MNSPERTWQESLPEKEINTGKTLFDLSGLKHGTTYGYRVCVKHEDGKSWDYRSGSFTTHEIIQK